MSMITNMKFEEESIKEDINKTTNNILQINFGKLVKIIADNLYIKTDLKNKKIYQRYLIELWKKWTEIIKNAIKAAIEEPNIIKEEEEKERK